ncbi:MAG: type II secretion system protein [Clostridia bacterium]|nr:type II secretion system protein [Clostridia bacterium]
MKNNKAFTIVELVIVLAVVAILAAVLIPTFARVIRNANISKDTQLIRNLNTALVADRASSNNRNHRNMSEAIAAVESIGYKADNIAPSVDGNEILWDQQNDAFCYLNGDMLEYVPESIAENPLTWGTSPSHLLWKIYDKMPDQQTFSIYWNGTGETDFEVNVGFDVGKADGIASVTYTGVSPAKEDVLLRTNSDSTALNVTVFNDTTTCDTVKHYDSAGIVTIYDAGNNSYHEFGNVTRINANSGHVVIEEGGSVITVVSFDGDLVVLDNNGGEITNAYGASDTTNTGNVALEPFVGEEAALELVTTLNQILSGSTHNTMSDALTAVEAAGYSIARIRATAEDNILWDQVHDVFCYLDANTVKYAAEVSGALDAGDYRLWKIYSSMPSTQTYSIYWIGSGVSTFEVSVGFDAGKKASAITVKYVGGESAKDDVMIRTIGGTLVLNNANDTIKHYGMAEAVFYRSVGENKYVKYATVYAEVDPEMRWGAKFAGTAKRTAYYRLSTKKNYRFLRGTVIQIVGDGCDFNIVNTTSDSSENTGSASVSDSFFVGGKNEWKNNGAALQILEDGYYGMQFRHTNADSTNYQSVDDIILEDVIRISYMPETTYNNSKVSKVSSVISGAEDQVYGYFNLEEVHGDSFFPDSSQDGFIYDEKVYVSNSGDNTVKIVSLSDGTLSGSIAYDTWSTNKVHGNSVHLRTVGSQHYIYSNIYNSYANSTDKRMGECCVYETDLNSTSTLVQIIKISFINDSDKWPQPSQQQNNDERPYGNFVIDEQNDLLYVYVMDIHNNVTKWFKFNLPDPTASNSEGNVYYLYYADVLDSWTTTYMNKMQGVTIANGLIYSLEGLSGAPGIRVIDPDLKKELVYIGVDRLDAYKSEPEFISYYNGNLYYGCGSHKLYKLIIK